ncbi:hypothetical protein ACWDRB_64840 [Nonomuraea sp. NPDC003707]
MDDPRANDRDDEGRRRERAAGHRLAARHGEAADRWAAARDEGYALPVLQAVQRVALALQDPRPDPHGPAAAPGDIDDALTLLGHARAALDRYELHLLDAARAADRDWATIAALLGGPGGALGGDQVRARHAELLRALPGSRSGPASAAASDNGPQSLVSSTAGHGDVLARALPLPAHACGIAWGVCPQHGSTLAVSGDLTRCQQGDRSWPGDRLNQRCREPITWKGTQHSFNDPERPIFGLCDGHAIAVSEIDDTVKLAQFNGSVEGVTGQWRDVSLTSAIYVRRRYQVSGAKRSGRITFAGRPGAIIGCRGGYLLVRFDDAPDSRLLCHPTVNVTYGDAGERLGRHHHLDRQGR